MKNSLLPVLAFIASLSSLSAQSPEPVDRASLLTKPTADASIVTGASGVNEKAITQVIRVTPGPQALAKALEEAKEKLRNGTPVKVLIAPGIYREGELVIDGTKIGGAAASTPLIIAAERTGTVTISGADEFPAKNWKAVKDASGKVFAYEHPWPHDFGFWPTGNKNYNPKSPYEHRREVAKINGVPLRQVVLEQYSYTAPPTDPKNHELSLPFPEGTVQDSFLAGLNWPTFRTPNILSKFDDYGVYVYKQMVEPATLAPGTFGVAERPENGDRIFIAPPDNVKWAEITVEVSVRPYLLWIVNKSNVVVRGLNFEMAAAMAGPRSAVRLGTWFPPTQGAGIQDQNLLMEDCHFDFGNGTHLEVSYSKDVTLRRIKATRAAASGITTTHVQNFLWDTVETSYNHWRYVGGWGGGGSKNHNIQDGVFRNVTAVGNDAIALWFDIDCANITVDGLVAYGNRVGLDFEIGKGLLVRNSVIAANAKAAVALKAANQMSIENSIIAGPTGVANFIFQAASRGASGERSIQTLLGLPRNDPYVLDRLTIKNSVILGLPQEACPPGAERYDHDRGVRASGFVAPLFVEHHGWPREIYQKFIRNGYAGSGNLWFSPEAKPFGIGKIMDSPEWRSKPNVNEWIGFDSWASLVAEQNSQWIDPGFVNAAALDFTAKTNSPASKMKLPVFRISAERRAEWEAFSKADFYKSSERSEVIDVIVQ